ncbi:hypothetical protein KHQ82_08170 [Mycoplasmatota bacterium]|nr:hypothetical protein KHQ82_08170 [Mycoplasmatota bacterium]
MSDSVTDIVLLELKEELVDFLVTASEVDTVHAYNILDNYLKDNYRLREGKDCVYDSSDWNNNALDPIPILCTVDGEEKLFNIILTEFESNLYDFPIATNGDLYLNGTSFIDGFTLANKMYLSNHTLNGNSAADIYSDISIIPLLDNLERSENNFAYFDRDYYLVGTDIYTKELYGCYSDLSSQCYNVIGNTIYSSFNTLTIDNLVSDENIMLYTHTNNNTIDNNKTLPIVKITNINKYELTLPSFSFNNTVNDLLLTVRGSGINYVDQLDPYTISEYDVNNDLLCWTDLYSGANCPSSDLNSSTDTEISTINYDAQDHIVFADGDGISNNYSLTLNPFVEHFGSDTGKVIYIEGDLIINNVDSLLEINGNIVTTGDVIFQGNINQLKLTGNIYSFGSIVFDMNSNLNGLNNSTNEIGFLFSKENIVITDSYSAYPAEKLSMSGYFYAEGSILIDTSKYTALNLQGGLYSEAKIRNLNTNFPLKIDGYDFNFNGIMINSYSGHIDSLGNYVPSLIPGEARSYIVPHPNKELIDGPDIFLQTFADNQFTLEIVEAG